MMAVEADVGKDWRDEGVEALKAHLLLQTDIRYCVLASLDQAFDAHLAQAENLQALFVALNDQVFEIRGAGHLHCGPAQQHEPSLCHALPAQMLIQVRV